MSTYTVATKKDKEGGQDVVKFVANGTVNLAMADGHGKDGYYAALFAVDAWLTDPIEHSERVSRHLNEKSCFTGGTTFTSMIAKEGEIILSQIGDTEWLYITLDTFISTPFHHSPANLEEFRRIYSINPSLKWVYGGSENRPIFVEENGEWQKNPKGPESLCTVRGDPTAHVENAYGRGLAMTRTLGDPHMGLPNMPDIFHLHPDEPFAVVIATDGLWDVVQYEAIVKIVRRHLANKTAEDAATEIMSYALQENKRHFSDYHDDITIAVVMS